MAHSGTLARAETVKVLTRIAEPVLVALSEGQLRARMPVECAPGSTDRHLYTHLEALGRLLAGIAPWLELGPDATEEGKLRERYIGLSVEAIRQAVDPHSADFMNFNRGQQPLVDAAFLAQGLLRAPGQLWGRLGERDRARVITALQATRAIRPPRNNWLLCSAMIEAALWKFSGACETGPMETAVPEHLAWYKGDGAYGDGPGFHWDYYNSYVIHPMLLEVLGVCAEKGHPLGEAYPVILERARRYAAVLERMISPEGTFPVMGRSNCYRFGAMQALALMALRHQLPAELTPGGVRVALTAVIRRMIEVPGTFDGQGWLRVGVTGHQPAMGEHYISTGSLYLCSVGLVHLGLPPGDPFWTEPDAPWTQQRIWSGENSVADRAHADASPLPWRDVAGRFFAELREALRRAVKRGD